MINKKNGIAYEFIEGTSGCDVNLVFVHGSGCNKTFLRPIQECISEHNCYFVDLPGHGDSDDTGYTPENYVNSVAEFVKDINNVIIIGHSLGGTIVAGIAAKNVKSVKGALIISSGASFPKLDKNFMNKIHNNILDMNFLLKCLGDLTNPLVKKVLSTIEPEASMIRDFLIDEKIDFSDSLKHIKIPTVITTGANEILTLVEYSEFLHSNIKASKLVIVPKVRHMLPIVKRERIAKLINRLIDKINS